MVGAQKSWGLMFWEDEKIGYLKIKIKSIFQRTRRKFFKWVFFLKFLGRTQRKFKMGSFLQILGSTQRKFRNGCFPKIIVKNTREI
jgi:hypothetical protein